MKWLLYPFAVPLRLRERGRWHRREEWQEMEENARQRWAQAVQECDLPAPQPWEPWHRWAVRELQERMSRVRDFWDSLFY